MKNILCLSAVLLLVGCGTTRQVSAGNEIMAVLNAQAVAWNDGDIENYMKAGYWQNDSLLFIGRNGPTYGYNETLEKYKKSYASKALMGKLSFSNISMEHLSQEYCYVLGMWNIKRESGDIGGYFTLLFRKINGGWLIVKDHTS